MPHTPGHLSFDEMRLAARRRLPRGLFDYIDRGVGREAGLLALRERLDQTLIAPRVLRAEKPRQISCDLFGTIHDAPFVIAPTAMAGLIARDGEVVLARAAAQHGFPVCLSTQSVTSVGDLRRAVPDATIWMQLYLWQERRFSVGLLERARQAAVDVLVMTVDTPYGARKEWNIRSGFDMPFRLSARGIVDLGLHLPWALRTIVPGLLRSGWPRLANYPDGMQPRLIGRPVDPRVSLRHPLGWDDVRWVRDQWKGTLILKGVLTPEDAQQAVAVGADGIVVSSHGARNLDAAPVPIDVLPDIRGVVGGQLVILADSGIRDGLDVLRYRLAGAKAVMLGRFPLWALASGGASGVKAAFTTLRQSYIEALDFTGAESEALSG